MESIDWPLVGAELDAQGWAILPGLLTDGECDGIAGLYDGAGFRSRVVSEPGHDFQGGEFVLTEQRPRMQTRVAVASLNKGDAVVLALRHGVSRVRAGRRHTLGIIFHDAA